MSSNKKIRNRLNKLFNDIQATESEETLAAQRQRRTPARAPEQPGLGKAGIPSQNIGSQPQKAVLAEVETLSEAGALSIPFQAGNYWNLFQLQSAEVQNFDEEEQNLVKQVADQLGLALQNAQLFQQTERQNRDLAILNEMARQLATQLDLNAIIQSIYHYASQLMDTSSFLVALFDEQNNKVTFPFVIVNDKSIELAPRVPGNGLTDYVLRNRQLLLLNGDVEAQMREKGIDFLHLSNTQPARSWLGVPLALGEKTLGAMVVQSVTTPYLYNERERDLLTAIGSQASISIQNARLFAETQDRANEMASLNEIIRAGTQHIDIHENLRAIYQEIKKLIKMDAFLIALHNETENAITYPLFIDDEVEYKYEQSTLNPNNLIGRALLTGQSQLLLVSQDELNEKTRESMGSEKLSASLIYVPLKLANKSIGVLSAQSYSLNAYTPETVKLLENIANQITVSIQNALFIQELEQRENQLAEALQIAKLANWEFDFVNGVFIFNDQFYSILHTTAEKEGGYRLSSEQYITRFVYPEDAHIISDEIEKALKAPQALYTNQLTHRIQYADGGIGYIGMRIFLEKNAQGQPIRWYGANQDITETRKAEEALERSEAELRTLFSSMEDVVLVLDKDTRYLRIAPTNPGRLFRPANELLGQRMDEILPPETAQPLKETVNRVIASGETTQIEYRLEIEGNEFWFLASVSKLAEDEVFWVARDITARKQAEERMLRQNQYLETATEVGRLITSTLDIESIFSNTVDLIRSRFNYYHVALFMLSEDGESALLREGTGSAGKQMKESHFAYSIDTNSDIGKVISTGKTLVINDTLRHATYRHNPLLPETRSRAYIPLKIGARAFGMLDIQSSQPHSFEAEDIAVMEPLADQIAVSVQNAQLYDESQKTLRDLAFVNRLTSAVSGSLDIQAGLQTIADELQKTFNVAHVGITMINPEKTHLILTADSPLPADGNSDIGLQLPIEGNLSTQQVIASKKPIFVQDVSTNPLTASIAEILAGRGTKNLLIFPLLAGNEVVGTVGFDTAELEQTFSDSEIRLVETILYQVASSIRNSQLFIQTQTAGEALRRQNEYLATAAEVSRLITSTLDVQNLFSRTVDLIRSRFGYYYAGVFTVDDDNFTAVLREGTGAAGEQMKIRHHSLPVGSKSIIGAVTATGKTLVVNDTVNDPTHKINPILPDTRAEAGIPLKIGSRVIGALDIQATMAHAFHPEDVAVLETLADQIAVALDNARSYDIAQKAVEEMRELDIMKSQFLANMSHELRTPLNSIIGFSRVILKGIDGPISDQQQQDLSAIYNSGQHLLGLINNILDLSKIDAGKMELTVEELNIKDTIVGVISTAAGLVKDKPVKILHDIEDTLPTARADPMRIRQVLLNLISNAAKFTEEGSITISAKTHRTANGVYEVLIGVTDTGAGIAPEDQKKLFQAFSQVDSSPTRKTGGTGLGLSICKRLVELHGGSIGVDSTVGQGSTFYFSIPLYRSPFQTDNNEKERLILCVDDDTQIIHLYERYLQPQGFQIIPAFNPASAVETARRLQPYAITLDIMMPEIDGWAVLSQLKADPETRDIPVIICSIVEEEEKGFSLGAADYIVKPIAEESLVNALNRINRDGDIKQVLLIDDSQEDLHLIEKMLQEHSEYRTITALGGEQGWESIQTHKPDAILLDLFMPDINGFSILERLRTEPRLRDLPVIVVSGVELNAEQKQQLNDLGKTMLEKGMLNQDELFSTLEKALNRLKSK